MSGQASHARLWPIEPAGGEVVAFPLRAAAALPEFGRRAERERFSLVVDLAGEELGPRWWRGAGTLAALCASALLLAPGFEPLAGAAPSGPKQLAYINLGSLAPSLPPEGIAPVVVPLPKGLARGEKDGVERIGGDVAAGLYWSLRDAGATPELAADYLRAIATRIDVGDVTPFDRFEFAIAKGSDVLLYAGLQRTTGDNVELMKWAPGGRVGWFDGNAGQQRSDGLMAPVAGRVTSTFGTRVHPILRYSRFHAGVDFGAVSGTPIVAAADGQVTGAGWSGGYGRQVRLAHGSGLTTTYSHLSSIAAAPGMPVRQGQVIGYVGSSGLSTGPHLHFEVRSYGRAIDPLTAKLVSRPLLDGAQLAAFKAQLKKLRAIPTKAVPAALPTSAA
ncbi:MAG: M23 family metallopeptidase [Pseudomonadota bacterium]|nr:M23 family metallopeptidase [Pseudomonadota bacterium]